jgi:hypothetical protein
MNDKPAASYAPVSTSASRVALGDMRDDLQTPTLTHTDLVDSAVTTQRPSLLRMVGPLPSDFVSQLIRPHVGVGHRFRHGSFPAQQHDCVAPCWDALRNQKHVVV